MKKLTFITTLFLFLLFFNLIIITISTLRLEESLDHINKKSLDEHFFYATSLSRDMEFQKENPINLTSIVEPYLFLANRNQINISLFLNEKLIATNANRTTFPTLDFSTIEPNSQYVFKETFIDIAPFPIGSTPINTSDIIANGINSNATSTEKTHFYVAGTLPSPYTDYVLIYSYDITEIIKRWRSSNNSLSLLGGIAALILSFCLLLLINYIFRPLLDFSKASKMIASGNYQERLTYTGYSELNDLAKNFNLMANEVEKKCMSLQK